MKITVTKADGSAEIFGNVMWFKADGETHMLDVSYAIDAQIHQRNYVSGQWTALQVDPAAPVDYHLPPTPYR